MNSFEMTDIDGDALTFITRDGSTWITCTSGADEVTVGPFPTHLLRGALRAEPLGNEQLTTTFIGSPAPTSTPPEGAQELRLLTPMSVDPEAPAVQQAPLARREDCG